MFMALVLEIICYDMLFVDLIYSKEI